MTTTTMTDAQKEEQRRQWFVEPPDNALPRLLMVSPGREVLGLLAHEPVPQGTPEPWLLKQWVEAVHQQVERPATTAVQRAWDLGRDIRAWLQPPTDCPSGAFLIARILVFLVGSPPARCRLPDRDLQFLRYVENALDAFKKNLGSWNPWVDQHTVTLVLRLMLAYEMHFMWRELRPIA